MSAPRWRAFLNEYWDALTATYHDPILYDRTRDDFVLRYYQQLVGANDMAQDRPGLIPGHTQVTTTRHRQARR